MAKLTPLAKVLISLAILSTAAAAAWQLGVKDLVMGTGDDPTDEPVADGAPDTKKPSSKKAGTGPLGSASNPLKVSIVSFHGYAPAIVANGNALETKPGSLYDQLGVHVKLVIQDDIPTLSTIFESGAAQCAWRTSDFWAQEQPNLRNAGRDAAAIMIVDNTQGGDAIITRDPAIERVEDLAGKKVAMLQFTPSHGMVIDAIDNSSLTAKKKASVDYVFINAEEGTAGVRAAFESGAVSAAALWDPDLALALKAVPGSKVVYSTKTATNLIYDVIVCDRGPLNDPANTEVYAKFVEGWMKGVDAAEKDPDNAVTALVETEEFFALLAKDQGRDFVKGLFSNVVWTGLDDNARILGIAGDTDHYARVYKRFDGIYRAAGALANPASPVIDPSESFDRRFIERLLASAAPAVKEEAARPQFTFDAAAATQAASKEAALTKPVTVGFSSGSAELTKRAEKTIDEEMVPLIENNGSAYFEVSGNTDGTGTRAANVALSKRRAQAVVDYLVAQWEFPKERFVVKGNGPDAPLCNEARPEADELNLEDCRALNRTTRVAVLVR